MDTLSVLKDLKRFMNVEDPEPERLPCVFNTDSDSQGSGNTYTANAPARNKSNELPIYQAAMGGGQRVPILKTVLTSACERNCYYCAFRTGRDFRRHTFQPEELAKSFVQMWRAKVVEGLFLSSGVAGGGIHTQDRLLATADILRNKLGFTGYLHLKLMPGAEEAQIERSMQLANRVSVNLEAPTTSHLNHLAPQKIMLEELLAPLQRVEAIRRKMPNSLGWNNHWPSSTTQFVVGADNENDIELMRATAYLQNRLGLTRIYYSRFNPVSDTPLEDRPAENPWRVHRLYQASFLLRDYGFVFEDLPFTPQGGLPLTVDPKLVWARQHLSETPLEINRADLSQLLRIPGIGPRRAKAVLSARREHPLHSLHELRAIGIPVERAAPFILLSGKRPTYQMPLV